MTNDTGSPAADTASCDGEGPQPRRRLRALLILLALVALLAWGAAAVTTVLTAGGELVAARGFAEQGRAALFDADAAGARDNLAAADETFTAAAQRLRAPVVLPLRAVPGVRANVRAATALAAAGARAAAAGETVAGALAELPEGVRTVLPRAGAIPLEPIEQLAPALHRADGLLAEAVALAASAPADGLVGPLADARAELLPILDDAADATATAATLVDVLPAFLGADEPRRYFLGAANPAELRGASGFIGAYAVLTVDDGELDIGSFAAPYDMPGAAVDEIPAPDPDYAARYNRYGGAGDWQNLTMTPNFPSAATAIETLYETVTGQVLDGTVVVDPHMLAGLLRLTGSTQAPDGTSVDADNVVAYVANEAYAELPDPDERKELLGAVAAGALGQFLRGDTDVGADPVEAVRVLGEAAGRGHLLLHATDPAVQAAFEDTGVAGALLDPDGDYLAVVVNNATANKADFFAERTVHYRVELLPDGDATATVAVELENHAPVEGLPAYVIGPNVEGATAGDNRSLLSVYCASGCERDGFRRSLGDVGLREESELGHPVFTTMALLGSGETERIELDWTLEDVWQPDGERGMYRLTVQDQPTIRPTELVVEVIPPEGMTVTSTSPGFESTREGVRRIGPVRRTSVLEVGISVGQ